MKVTHNKAIKPTQGQCF